MALQSCPQASATALIAFITPLLCVVALYGSATAKWCASRMAEITFLPLSGLPSSDISSGVNVASTLARRFEARFERILRCTLPPVISSTFPVISSAMVLTAFAPIASLVSTRRCITSIFPDIVSIVLTIMSLHPPPSLIIVDGKELHIAISSYLAVRIASPAMSWSSKSRTWI